MRSLCVRSCSPDAAGRAQPDGESGPTPEHRLCLLPVTRRRIEGLTWHGSGRMLLLTDKSETIVIADLGRCSSQQPVVRARKGAAGRSTASGRCSQYRAPARVEFYWKGESSRIGKSGTKHPRWGARAAAPFAGRKTSSRLGVAERRWCNRPTNGRLTTSQVVIRSPDAGSDGRSPAAAAARHGPILLGIPRPIRGLAAGVSNSQHLLHCAADRLAGLFAAIWRLTPRMQ